MGTSTSPFTTSRPNIFAQKTTSKSPFNTSTTTQNVLNPTSRDAEFLKAYQKLTENPYGLNKDSKPSIYNSRENYISQSLDIDFPLNSTSPDEPISLKFQPHRPPPDLSKPFTG
jgi:hypothetical protein